MTTQSSYTSTIIFGGTPPNTGKTESWNGSSWTETNDMSTARHRGGGAGATSGAGLCFGGNAPGDSNATEAFSADDFQIKSVTTS